MTPERRYATTADGVRIAYQMFGEGTHTLVVCLGMISCVDYQWEVPEVRDALERLARFSRVVTFDRRGSGSSDRFSGRRPAARDRRRGCRRRGGRGRRRPRLPVGCDTGDGLVARFDGPARAVRCGLALGQGASALGLGLRAGCHTGEIEITPDGLRGITVHVTARICAQAGGGTLLISAVVRDLTAGSGLSFEPAGEYDLKGVPDRWTLFAADERR